MSDIMAAWLPGLPHVLRPDLSHGYQTLNRAAVAVGEEFQRRGVKRILYYSTQWLSVLGHSVQSRAYPEGVHVDENWYDMTNLPFKFTIDTKFAQRMLGDLSKAGYQARAVDYEGFPIDTGTIVADTLINPKKIASGMFSCCVYSDYQDTVKLGQILKESLAQQDGQSAVVVVSGLSSRYFTTEIDLREDHIRSTEDDAANQKLLDLMTSGDWKSIQAMRDSYCREVKADMGLKALAFLEGMGFAAGEKRLQPKAYAAVYGTGAAVLTSW